MDDLSWAETQLLVERAIARGDDEQLAVAVAVVDGGRELAGFGRREGAMLATIQLAIAKAYTACSMRRPTQQLHHRTFSGEDLHGLQGAHDPPLVALGGGAPLWRGDRCVGALGISGGTTEQDHAIAMQVAEAFNHGTDEET